VIGMTAAAMAEDRARCLAAGMLDHLAKPVMPERLLDILLKWVPRPIRASDRLPADHEAPDGPGEAPAASGLPPAATASPMPATPLPVPEFNIEALRKRVMGNEALVWRLLERFVELEKGSSALLRDLLADGRREELQRKAHSLRGACALLELSSVVRACEQVEAAVSQSAPLEDATQRLMAHLEGAVAVVREVLESRRTG
jgi:HPt (histidine-containing phosphotransfer) domain-containing protein